MNHFKNHLKKGTITLVIAMLLTIPNMQVYSFIGSYKISSMAITANELYKSSRLAADPISVSLLAAIGTAVAIAMSVGFSALIGAGVGAIGTTVVAMKASKGTLPLISKYDEKDYQKHDFSKFDN